MEWTVPLIAFNQYFLEEPHRIITVRTMGAVCLAGGGFLFVFRCWIRRQRADLFLLSATLFFLAGIFVTIDGYLGYKAAKFGRPGEYIQNVHIPHNELGWVPKPGAVGHHVRKNNFDVIYEIDDQGFRQTPHPINSLVTVYFFGDSFTFGHGVDNKDTFANILAQDYFDSHVRVVNGGVKGYGIVQMYGRFLEILPQLKKNDLVVFTPTTQDVERSWEDFRFPAQFIFKSRGGRVEYYPYFRDGQLGIGRIDTPLNRIRALLLLSPYSGKMYAGLHRALVRPRDKEQSHEIFQMVQRFCDAKGAKFVLIFLPTVQELKSQKYKVDVSSFDYYDIREFFPSNSRDLRELRFPEDSHWNPSGQEIAAHAIKSTLVREKLLEEKFIQDGLLFSSSNS